MGLIAITCEYPLPDPRYQDEHFRTYDLGYGVAYYCITAEGRLVWRKYDPLLLGSSEKSKVPEQVTEDMDFHGSFRFGIFYGDNSIDYRARFVRGTVREITRITRNIDDQYDLDTCPGLADAAEGIERVRLFDHRRLLRDLEELEPKFTKHALYIWGNRTDLAYWLATPHPALDELTPYRALALGKHRDVLELLDRLFYGIPG